MKLVHSFLLLCTAITLSAQTNDTQNSIVKNIPFENIGPKVMSGRIVALEVNPADPTEFPTTSDTMNRIPCSICSRKFAPDALDRHSKICQKANNGPKRK